MPEAREPDVIRLSLPADPDLRAVVEVGVAVLARRLRFADDAISSARTAAGAAFDDVAGQAAGKTLEIEILVAEAQLVLRVRAGEATRSVTLPDESPDRHG
jgi:hypothetical protein